MPHARRTDPETSHAAARSITNLTDAQFAILQFIRTRGEMADHELVARYQGWCKGVYGQTWPQMSESGIRTRRKELTDQGLVVDTGVRVPTQSGRQAIVWRALTGREVHAQAIAGTVQAVRQEAREQRTEGALFDADEGAPRTHDIA